MKPLLNDAFGSEIVSTKEFKRVRDLGVKLKFRALPVSKETVHDIGYFFKITNSTRLFFCLFFSVSFGEIGCVPPNPFPLMRDL